MPAAPFFLGLHVLGIDVSEDGSFELIMQSPRGERQHVTLADARMLINRAPEGALRNELGDALAVCQRAGRQLRQPS